MAEEPGTPAAPGTLRRLLGDTEPVRRALYPVVVAVVALLVAYGLLDADRVPLWLALAVAVLGVGGTEAARSVAYAPATVHTYGAEWAAALDRALAVDDTPGAHAADRVRTATTAEALDATQQLERVNAEPATGLIQAPSRATRCREVDDRRRCVLPRGHDGPHKMTTG